MVINFVKILQLAECELDAPILPDKVVGRDEDNGQDRHREAEVGQLLQLPVGQEPVAPIGLLK